MRVGLLAGILFSFEAGGVATAAWKLIGPEGRRVGTLAINPKSPSTLYAGTPQGEVFVSTNRGANWTAADNGLPGDPVVVLTIDPQTPSTLYAGTYGGVFVSTDNGSSWTAANA